MLIGWARGGRLEALALTSFKGLPILGIGAAMVIVARVPPTPAIPARILQALGYLAALVVLWQNRSHRWTFPIMVGLGLNSLVIALNGGRMPVSHAALARVTHATLSVDPRHVIVGAGTRLAMLGDVVPLALGALGAVLSPGDVLMGLGLAGFVQAEMCAARAGART